MRCFARYSIGLNQPATNAGAPRCSTPPASATHGLLGVSVGFSDADGDSLR